MTRLDQLSDDAPRSTAPPNAGNPAGPADGNGGFDVQPVHVGKVAIETAEQAKEFIKSGFELLDGLDATDQAAGNGDGADAFADRYMEISTLYLLVWAESAWAISGAAEGFTTTATTYMAANHASNPFAKGKGSLAKAAQPPDKPRYGKPPSLKWTGRGDDSEYSVVAILGDIPDAVATVVQPAVEHVLNLGELHRVTPGANEQELHDVAMAWRSATKALIEHAYQLQVIVSQITDPRNGEWQAAMTAFCQTLWGTAAWGKRHHSANWKTDARVPAIRHPVVTVLERVAHVIAEACIAVADAHSSMAEKNRTLLRSAAKETVDDLKSPDLGDLFGALTKTPVGEVISTFRSKMDSAAMNRAVDTYDDVCRREAERLRRNIPKLEEAQRAAPTFRSQSARAQAFSARSLNEFKREHKYQVSGENPKDHYYPIDLTTEEGLHGAHSVDKHVGKRDSQLASRLRDQENIDAASSYKNLKDAQKYTQQVLDDDGNMEKIERFINKQPPPEDGAYFPEALRKTFTDPVGTSVSRSDYDSDGVKAQGTSVHTAKVMLQYRKGLDPPFVVVTSMPTVR
ncbi:RNase A-like domain-containing protein [Streptomyces sp. NPDC048172]|uniref:RNase A-like domain-containing protein n=1 Tax=Streptomyces sp. NPDC048172 TaxID=3365505 RepID=UPI00371E4F16